jgi:uncharacterized membrane protein (DUF106 family)
LTGAILYGLTYSQVFPKISALANYGSVVMPDLWNLNPYLVVLLFGLITVLLFYLIDRSGLHRKKQIEHESK